MQATASRLRVDGRRAAQAAVVLLFVAMAIEGISVEVFGLTLRAPYLAAPIAWLVILFNSRRERTPIRIPVPALFLLAWLAVLAISSAVSPLPLAGTTVHLLRFSLLVATFLALPNLIRDEEMVAWAIRAFVVTITHEFGLALLLFGVRAVTGLSMPGLREGYEACPVVAANGTLILNIFLGHLAMIGTNLPRQEPQGAGRQDLTIRARSARKSQHRQNAGQAQPVRRLVLSHDQIQI